jgi:hypothetical protein
VSEVIKKFPPRCDKELLKEMDKFLKVKLGEKQITDFKLNEMEFKEERLKKLSDIVKRKRIDLYLSFNHIFLELMPYIEISKKQKEGSMQQTFYSVK